METTILFSTEISFRNLLFRSRQTNDTLWNFLTNYHRNWSQWWMTIYTLLHYTQRITLLHFIVHLEILVSILYLCKTIYLRLLWMIRFLVMIENEWYKKSGFKAEFTISHFVRWQYILSRKWIKWRSTYDLIMKTTHQHHHHYQQSMVVVILWNV